MKNDKIKININRPGITKEEVSRNKNFRNVLYNYSEVRKPLYRRPKFLSTVVLISVILLVIVLEINEDKKIVQVQESFINPPIAAVDIPYQRVVLNAAEKKVLLYKTGSTISIPENAFIDENGNPVKGEVEITYREFHNPLEIFLSGIPMTYDSAGTQYHFESAGMMEINGFQNGKPVFVNPEKQIDIKMASFQQGTDYNLYQLDSNERNWKYKGRDVIVKAEEDKPGRVASEDLPIGNEIKQEIAEIQTEIKKLKKEKPVEPNKADPNRFKFNLDVDAKEFPELAIYKGMEFEIGEENKGFTPAMSQITWEDASLTQGNSENNYFLTLKRGSEFHKLVVYPVFEGKDYDAAMKTYSNKFNEYKEKLDDRKAEEKRKKEEYDAFLKAEEEKRIAWQKQYDEDQKKYEEEQKRLNAQMIEQQKKWKEDQEKQLMAMDNESKIFRTFSINSFGTYNCDRPEILPKGQTLAANFLNGEGKGLTFHKVFLVEKGRNAVFTYYSTFFNRISFNPDKENMIWAVTPDSKLAIFKKEGFDGISKKSKSHDFKMEVIDVKFTSAEEIKKYMGI